MASIRSVSLVALVCMAMAVSFATAVDYNTQCKTPVVGDKVDGAFPIMPSDASGAPTCYYFPESGDTDNPTISFTYTNRMKSNGMTYDLLLWNIDQTAAWSATITGTGAAFGGNLNGRISSATLGVFGRTMSFSTATCSGSTYEFSINVNGNLGVMFVPRPDSSVVPSMSSAAAWSYNKLATMSELVVQIAEPFAVQQRAAKSIDVTLTASELPASAPTAQLATSKVAGNGGANTISPTLEQTAAGSVVLKFGKYGLDFDLIKGNVRLTVKLPTIDNVYVNWKENGPYRMGSLAIVSTMFPTLTSTWQMVDLSAGNAFVRVAGGAWWQSANVFYHFGGDDAPTGSGYSTAESSINYGIANAFDRTSIATAFTGTITNTAIVGSLTLGATTTVAGYPELSGGMLRETSAYLRVNAPACTAKTTPTKVWLKATYSDLTGECFSNADCNPGKDDDKAAGHVLSANGDRDRMRTCRVLPSPFDVGVYSTRCTECAITAECGASQYCHADVGICTSNGNKFVCDAASNALAGVCRKKDPSGVIIGEPCRTSSVNTWSSTNAGVLNSRTVSEGASADSITGSALCGEALYYNASYVPDSDYFTSPSGVARAALWTGTCQAGICYECTPGSSNAPFQASGKGGVQCVNGREVERRDVDFTIRTLTSNTIAGILVTAVIGILLIIICLCVNAHQTMSKGEAYRKTLHQKYEDDQLVRAKSGRV